MFNYYEKRKDLIKLRDKIYTKQKDVFEIMHQKKISFENLEIKTYLDEINLLEEIFDIRRSYFDYDSKKYWDNKDIQSIYDR